MNQKKWKKYLTEETVVVKNNMSYPLPHASCATPRCKEFNSPLYGASPHSTRKFIALKAVYELVKLGITFVKGHDWRPKDWEKLNRDERMKLKVTRALEVLTKDEKKVLEDASYTVLRDYKEVPLSLGTKTGPRDLKQSKPSPHEKFVIELARTVIYKMGIKSSKMRDIYGELELLERSELIQEIFMVLGIVDPVGVFDGINFLWYLNYLQEPNISAQEKDRRSMMAFASLIGIIIPWAWTPVIRTAGALIRVIKSNLVWLRRIIWLCKKLIELGGRGLLPRAFIDWVAEFRVKLQSEAALAGLPEPSKLAGTALADITAGTAGVGVLGLQLGLYAFLAHTECGKRFMQTAMASGVETVVSRWIELTEKEKGQLQLREADVDEMVNIIKQRIETLKAAEERAQTQLYIKVLEQFSKIIKAAAMKKFGEDQGIRLAKKLADEACALVANGKFVPGFRRDFDIAMKNIAGLTHEEAAEAWAQKRKVAKKETAATKPWPITAPGAAKSAPVREEKVDEHLDTLIPRDTPSRFKIGTIVVYKDRKLIGQEGEYIVFKTKSTTDTIIIVRREEWEDGKPTKDAETKTASYMQLMPLSAVKKEPIITGSKISKLDEEFEKIYLNIPI